MTSSGKVGVSTRNELSTDCAVGMVELLTHNMGAFMCVTTMLSELILIQSSIPSLVALVLRFHLGVFVPNLFS